jgi:hypothetical protein
MNTAIAFLATVHVQQLGKLREWVPELCAVCTRWPGRCGIRGASTTPTPTGCAMIKRSRMQALECLTSTFKASKARKARKIFLLNRRKHFESSSVASLLACVIDIKRWRVNTCAREPIATSASAMSIVSRGLASESRTVQKLETNPMWF